MSDTSVRQRKRDEDFAAELPRLRNNSNTAQRQRRTTCSSVCLFVLTCLTLPLAAVILWAMVVTSPIDPVVISLAAPPAFEGVLEPNTKLQKAVHMFEGILKGPESLVFDRTGHYLYTGTADGKIVEIYKNELRTIATLGKPPCGTPDLEQTCGRPLGMRFDKEGYLIVADSYLGLFKVNVVTGDVFPLLSASQPIAGEIAKFLNDLDIDSDGKIYFTDSSTRWSRRYNRYCAVEGRGDGRLFELDPESGNVKVLADKLAFANGVTLSTKEDYLLVAETTNARILRYWLNGPKKGKLDVFSDNLPGLPDNIRRSGRGTYWIALAGMRRGDKFSFFDYCASRPWLRKLFYKFFSQEFFLKTVPKYGLIIEVDKHGDIIQSLHDPTGEVIPAVSEVEEKDGTLYLGSYALPRLSKLKIRN